MKAMYHYGPGFLVIACSRTKAVKRDPEKMLGPSVREAHSVEEKVVKHARHASNRQPKGTGAATKGNKCGHQKEQAPTAPENRSPAGSPSELWHANQTAPMAAGPNCINCGEGTPRRKRAKKSIDIRDIHPRHKRSTTEKCSSSYGICVREILRDVRWGNL